MNRRYFYKILIPALILSLLPLVHCGGGEKNTLKQLYLDYHKALQNEDIAALKTFISSQHQGELLGENGESPENIIAKIRLIKAMIPGDITVTKTTISGNTAHLEVKGKIKEQSLTGQVDFIKENGQWKLDKESWQITIKMDSEEDSLPPAVFGTVEPFLKDPAQLPQPQLILEGHQGEVTALAFTPDNRFLVSSSYGDYSIRVWDPGTGDELSNTRTPNRVRGMAISPNGDAVITADAYNDIILWPLSEGTLGAPQTLFNNTGDAIAISPDGKYIASAGWEKPLQIWELQPKFLFKFLGQKKDQRVLRFSSSGNLFIAGGSGASFSIWDSKKWEEKTYSIDKISKDSTISSIDTTRDGKYLATGHNESSIVIFDLKKREELHNFYVRDAATMDVKFSPDCSLLATAHYDKTIYLWDAKTAKRLGVLKKHTDSVNILAFSIDGRVLASGGDDRKIILWGSGLPPVPITEEPTESDTGIEPKTGIESPATDEEPQPTEVQGQTNLIQAPHAHRLTAPWQTKGEVSIEKDPGEENNYYFTLRYSGMIWQDVPLKNAAGKYVLLIAWASSERVNPDGDQTGLPYLYGEMSRQDDQNRITAHLSGQQMMLRPTLADEWGIIYGIFQVPEQTGGLRFFMEQADGHEPQSGSAARFDKPGVFLFDSKTRAEEFVKDY